MYAAGGGDCRGRLAHHAGADEHHRPDYLQPVYYHLRQPHPQALLLYGAVCQRVRGTKALCRADAGGTGAEGRAGRGGPFPGGGPGGSGPCELCLSGQSAGAPRR
ncbi:hypothetical protein SDC9_125543 [bioreactor metagenome]|uniref:Uncharacterized protein n=1 Tax=bioreactor metagenome TaxID=1076179 RepID=A0A645CP40_9ZZZZ